MEYKILKSWNGVEQLEGDVQRYLLQGWVVSGGVACIDYTGDKMWTQAIVRSEA